MVHRNRNLDFSEPHTGAADRRGDAMNPFLKYAQAQERFMSYCRVEKFIDGRWTVVEEYGRDPLADKTENPTHGYWQNPNERRKFSTVEDEGGL